MRPRHDFFQFAYQTLRGFVDLDWKVVDEVELDFTFQDNGNVPECIWAIVAKDELKGIKASRWDMVSMSCCRLVPETNAMCRASLAPLRTLVYPSRSRLCQVGAHTIRLNGL